MKLEKTLIEMVGHFTPSRASEWLRFLFSSFETDAEPIAVDTTKNENAYFAEARRLGWVARLPETDSAAAANKPLVVVAVKMKGDLTERTSRLVQFVFAKKAIQNAIARGGRGIHGLPTQGLFFFYDADGYFRISLVSGEADGRKLKYNSAKRQSFYVDPTAANNILRRRLGDPITTFAALKNAFSVEQLTKEFYGRLFEWYTWALAPRTGVTFPNDLADEKDDRKYNHEAIIRLITRLMFTWFIRQKIPALKELFERDRLDETLKGNRGKGRFNPDSMEDDNYYRCILQNLFFATFNCPQTGKGKLLRRWINVDLDERGDGRGLCGDFNVTTVYRYRNEFKDPDAFLERMRGVPFLNCALFDCLDKAERKQDGGRKLYFDGFSTKIKRQAHVPNGLFFKEGQGIIDLFNGYEFTIDENSADDADVALDPELLGKVFENLLGAFNPETQETARKATGSFYTPREIVDYMVEESLKNYLKEKLGEGAKDPDAKLDDLFDRTKAAEGARTMFSRKEEEILLNALYDCKVLDPACGSGAFPMGVLHCMVRLLARLDPDSVSIRERLIARYRADKDSVDPAETASDRRERLAELEKCLDEGQHYPDYARKLYLIENCIYGVDIQPIATQISKLRFFISLLCDQFRTSFNGEENNYGLLALPNLEAKFVCANTLISLPETSGEFDLTTRGVAEARERLKINRHRIFGARSTGTKEKYKKRDLEIRDEIREAVTNVLAKPDESVIAACERQIKAAQSRRAKVAEPKWEERVVQVQMDLFSPVEARTERIDVNRQEREKIDSEIALAEKRIHDERAKAERSNVSAAQNYAALVAGWDPFDQNASSEFFDPEWMFNVTDGFDVVIGNPPYGAKLSDEEKKTYREAYPLVGFKIDTYVLFILAAGKFLGPKSICSYIIPNTFLDNSFDADTRKWILNQHLVELNDLTDKVFEGACVHSMILSFSSDVAQKEYFVKADISSELQSNNAMQIPVSFFLEQDGFSFNIRLYPYNGLLSKLNEGSVRLESVLDIRQTIKTGNDDKYITPKKVKKNCKPILRGRDVFRYAFTPPDLFVDYGRHLACPRDASIFEQPKILIREAGERITATMECENYYIMSSLYAAIPRTDKFELTYLLGLINSQLFQFLMDKIAFEKTQGAFTKAKIYHYYSLPVRNVDKEQQSNIDVLVKTILAAKKTDPAADTTTIESEIDQLVYKLYGLTDDEIAIVEGRNETKQEPQGETARRPAASPRRRRQATTPATPAPTDDEVLE